MSGVKMLGEVIKLSGEKTVKVAVVTTGMDSRYKKVIRSLRKFLCHNEIAGVHVGSVVELHRGRRVSKNKSLHIVRVVS